MLLLDEDSGCRGDGYREFKDGPTGGPFIPERTILSRPALIF